MFSSRRARKGPPVETLVVGLGNPGAAYAGSRHNVGADAVAGIVSDSSAKMKVSGADRAALAHVRRSGRSVVLAVPTTYMNESGAAVGRLARRFDVQPDQIIIVHDELDLEPGRVKVKCGGGLAGHNGLKSIRQHMKTDDFVRVRIGVGKPPHPNAGADHVLKPVPAGRRGDLDAGIALAGEAVDLILASGVEAAMGDINGRSR